MNKFSQVRSLQPGYIAIISEVALEALKAKINAARNPLYVYDYAEALDALISILPPKIKREIREKLKIDVDVVVSDAIRSCEKDQFNHPLLNTINCAKHLKSDLDKLLRIVFDLAHHHGLFVVEKEVSWGREV